MSQAEIDFLKELSQATSKAVDRTVELQKVRQREVELSQLLLEDLRRVTQICTDKLDEIEKEAVKTQ